MELGPIPTRRSGRLSVAAPSYVFTIRRVARMLSEDEERLYEIASGMEPEDGCLTILDLDEDDAVMAFTAQGIENLKELLAIIDEQ
jgi:hypothetical protein